MVKRNSSKKKSPSLVWRMTKALGRGVYHSGRAVVNSAKFLARHDQRGNPISVIESNDDPTVPSVSSSSHRVVSDPAKFAQFKVVKAEKGEFEKLSSTLLAKKGSVIALILGKRGSGKSALGFKVLENMRAKSERDCFVLGVGADVMPDWIQPVTSIDDVPAGSSVLVDEGAIAFSARDSMSKKNRSLSKLLAVARHKDLTVLFITQNTGMIDKNVLTLADMLLIKEGSLLQREMERAEIKKFYEKASKSFDKLKGDTRKYVYLIDSDFEGVVSHALPSFWSDKLSKNRSE